MSPRPRKASDEEVFAAAGRVMARLGPAQLTLADIATEVGLTAGALVQRFGSKRGLLLALSARAAETTSTFFADLRAAHRSPLAALRAYGACFAQMARSPGALVHHLAYLQIDLTDPDFHRSTLAQARATSAALRAVIEAGIAAGEIRPEADVSALVRAIQVTLSGSLLIWAFYQEGPAARWVAKDLNALLGPHLTPAVTRRRQRKRYIRS